MPDLHERLDRHASAFRPSDGALDRVLARAQRRRRNRRIAAGVVALSLCTFVGIGIALAFRGASPDRRPGEEPTPTVLPQPVHVPEHIGPLAATGDSLWALGGDSRARGDQYLLRLDPATGEVLASTQVPGAAVLASGGGSLWVSTYDRGRLVEVDPQTGGILRSVGLGHLGVVPYLATDGQSVFVVVNDTVQRLVPGAERTIPVASGYDANGLVFADGSLWLADAFNGSVVRLDPDTGEVLARIDGAWVGEPAGIAVGGGSVWAASPGGLLEIDPATNRVLDELAARSPYAYAESDGDLWVADTYRVWKIDTATGQVAVVQRGGHPVGLAVVNDTLWIANATDRIIGLPVCSPDCPR